MPRLLLIRYSPAGPALLSLCSESGRSSRNHTTSVRKSQPARIRPQPRIVATTGRRTWNNRPWLCHSQAVGYLTQERKRRQQNKPTQQQHTKKTKTNPTNKTQNTKTKRKTNTKKKKKQKKPHQD